jgi:hypothetical protein
MDRIFEVARRIALPLTIASLAASLGCSGGGDDTRIRGKAVTPPQLGGQPVANARLEVHDLERPDGQDLIGLDATNSNGDFDVQFNSSQAVFITVDAGVQGSAVPVSGLANAESDSSKDFAGATTIGCFAGVQAVRSGALSVDALDATHIANLEAAAAEEVPNTDFSNADSVNAAAARVRSRTNDGANPPA